MIWERDANWQPATEAVHGDGPPPRQRWNTVALALLAAALFWLPGCPPRAPNKTKDCTAACQHLGELGCDEAQPTPGRDGIVGTADDGTCVAVCRNVEESGTVRLFSECVATIKSCGEIDGCQP